MCLVDEYIVRTRARVCVGGLSEVLGWGWGVKGAYPLRVYVILISPPLSHGLLSSMSVL